MTIEIFGIKACDTMKKARVFLEERGVPHAFHDYKLEGVTAERLAEWAAKVGWERLLNRTSATSASSRRPIASTSPIKRLVLARGDDILVGFRPEGRAQFLG